MQIRVTKARAALAAAVLVVAGAGVSGVLSPLVGDALATVGQVVNISDHSSNAYFAKVDSTGALKVTAANSANNPVAVRDAAAYSPFQRHLTASFTSTDGFKEMSFTVPSFSRLELKNFSAQVTVPQGQRPRIDISIVAGGVTGHLYPALEFQSSINGGTIDLFNVSTPLPVYADKGSTVKVKINRNVLTGSAFALVTFTGVLHPG